MQALHWPPPAISFWINWWERLSIPCRGSRQPRSSRWLWYVNLCP